MKTRYISLFIVLALVAALVLWSLSTGMSIHYWYILASPFLLILLLALWYTPFGWGKLKTRLSVSGILLLLIALVAAVLTLCTTYEGSTSGSSLPKLAWRWADKSKPEIKSSINTEAVDNSIEAQAARASSNFLGPYGNGTYLKAEFDFDWQANPPVELWRRPIGEGWSSFAIAQGKAITIQQADTDETTTCINLLTGETLWEHADTDIDFVDSMQDSATAKMGGEGPRSTPTIYQDKVYIIGSIGHMKCLNIADGSEVWKQNPPKGPVPKWGKSSAPLIIENEKLVVFTGAENDQGPTLIACDLNSGQIKWTYNGNGASYSTPRLLALHNTPQIVSVNQNDITGVDPKTSKQLWLHEWQGNYPKVGQPLLLSGNRILGTASYGAQSPLIAVMKSGDTWSTKEIWKSKWMKTKFSSAVVLQDHAYGIDEGRLFAMDLATGGKVWKSVRVGFGQNLLFGNHLMVQVENPGDILWGTVSPEGFEEIYRLKGLGTLTWNAPTVAGRFLLLRNAHEAACFLLPEKR